MSKVVIVGGSASGSLCARDLAKKGVSTTVLEEHSLPGKYGKCSGIFSAKGLKALGVNAEHLALAKLKGAIVRSSAQEITIRSPEVQALVVQRQIFDEMLAHDAQDAGASFALGERVQDFAKNEVITEKRKYAYDVLVGADGFRSITAAKHGFPSLDQGVMCWEGDYENATPVSDELVEVLLDAGEYKGFFAWIVPLGEKGVRIGFGTSAHHDVQRAKNAFLQNAHVRNALGAHAKMVFEFFHPIPLRYRAVTQKGNVILVGDAAGQTKATTGGGVIFGGQCARVAADAIAEHVLDGKPLAYEHAWRAKHQKALDSHHFVRKAYNAMGNAAINASVAAARVLNLGEFLGKRGDMDYILSKSGA